MNLGLTISR